MTDLIFNHNYACYSKLYVGFSGGLDSTVLLHLLASQPELVQSIHAVHVNHDLNPFASDWEHHCEHICHEWGIAFSAHPVEIASTTNLEESARIARYGVFHAWMTTSDALLLAHHQDDQAETLLLNLMRGAGIDGLAAMLPIQATPQGDLIRPLLSTSRLQIEAYARQHDLRWVEDDSNQATHLSRNYIRHRIMPLLTAQWPSAAKNMARAATHCQQAKKNLEVLADLDGVTHAAVLPLSAVQHLSRDRLLNVLRAWIQYNGHQRPSEKTLHRLIDELIVARQDSEPMVTFGETVIRRYQHALYCLQQSPPQMQTISWPHFPNALDLGNQMGILDVESSDQGLAIPPLSSVEVRFRQGGERLRWHGQTKALKKLCQQWQIPPWVRDRIPLIYVNDVLAAVVGYAVSDDFYTEQDAVTILCHYL